MKKLLCMLIALCVMMSAAAALAEEGDAPPPGVEEGDSPLPGIEEGDAPLPDMEEGDASLPDIEEGDASLPGVEEGDASLPGVEEGDAGAGGAADPASLTVDIDGLFTLTRADGLEVLQLDDLEVLPPDEQDQGSRLLFSAYNDTLGFDIYRYDAGEDTLESLLEAYKADNQMTEVLLADVGGVKVLVYRVDETLIGATLSGGNGYLYEMMFNYQTLEEYQKVGAMIASIRKAGA